LKLCERAAVRFANLAKAHLAKGQQLARMGRYQESGPSFERAAELQPSAIEPLLGLAEVQNKAAKYEDSLKTYQRVLALDASDLTALLGAGRNLVSLARLTEAKGILEKAAADHADNAQVHVELAKVYARLGERDLSIEQTRISQRLHNEQSAADAAKGRQAR
jgi:tetratricopeptide (TPR) repeat protein